MSHSKAMSKPWHGTPGQQACGDCCSNFPSILLCLEKELYWAPRGMGLCPSSSSPSWRPATLGGQGGADVVQPRQQRHQPATNGLPVAARGGGVEVGKVITGGALRRGPGVCKQCRTGVRSGSTAVWACSWWYAVFRCCK